ncbi:MAG TPA: ATP-binding protein [Anaeromyxobacteraceae bacterium]|nr:ATP-binding protein [Anaeromyxobacteraceae bacterium]
MRPGALRSLRVELTATFVAVALLPPILVGAVGLHLTLAQLRRDAETRNRQMALAIAGEVSRYLESQLVALRVVEEDVDTWDAGSPQRHLAGLVRVDPALKSVLVLDTGARVLHSEPFDGDVIGVDLSGEPFVRTAMLRHEPTWSSATISMQTGQPVVALTVPGARYSVVGYLDLEALEGIVERTRVGEAGEATVVDRGGTIIAHRNRRLVREQASLSDLPLVAAALAGREETAEYEVEGRRWLGSVARVSPTNWMVLASEPLDVALAQATRLRALLLAAFAAAIAVAVATGLLSARRILEPIDALTRRAGRIEEGEYGQGSDGASGTSFPEIDALSHSFDTMAAAVAEREEALARSERNFRSLVSAPVVGIVRSHVDGTILYGNDAFARLANAESPESLLGTKAERLYANPADRDRLMEQIRRTGKAANFEAEFLSLSGERRVMLLNSARDGDAITTVAVDITELRDAARDRERLEQELFHAQKLEAVGRLAGSVAHDFNNLLTAIISHAALLEGVLPPGDPRHDDVGGILDSAQRAAHLTRSLLAYGRKQTLQKRAVDLREVVRSVEPLLQRLAGEHVELSVRLPPERLGVLADPTQIEQVLVNLCTNARDAMHGDGRIAVNADRIDLTADRARELGFAGPGSYVRLDVRDTGGGIPDDVRTRIFEPFYTTKDPGKGTGLGLAIVEGIVRQHGGHVAVESRIGEGTMFSVYLPSVDGVESRASPPQAEALAPGGRETVLLADDEPSVRRALRATLERAGYAVVEAVDGEDAVRKFEDHREEVALCLLDVIMPKRNGREAWQAIVALKPGTRVLFASGYTADILEKHREADSLPALIAKPVAPVELLRRVREALDGEA